MPVSLALTTVLLCDHAQVREGLLGLARKASRGKGSAKWAGSSRQSAENGTSTARASNWFSDHPFLSHYETSTDNGASCDPSGTSGDWWAATGKSGGWKQWQLDIPAEYLGDPIDSLVIASRASLPAARSATRASRGRRISGELENGPEAG